MSVIGGGVTGLANIAGAAYSAKQSQKQAREQMAFQERMSSTAHQREVADLRKAGLNPILSAGAGASSPGGAMGMVPDLSDMGSRITSSASDAARTQSGVKSQAQERLNMQTTNQNLQKQGDILEQEKHKAYATRLIADAEAWNAQNVKNFKANSPEFWAKTDAILPLISQVLGSARDVSQIYSSFATPKAIRGVTSPTQSKKWDPKQGFNIYNELKR